MKETISDTAYYYNELYHKEYFESGKIKAESFLVDTIGSVTWKEYYESGKIKCITTVIDSNKCSSWKEFYESGALSLESKIGCGSVPYKTYYENGQKEYEGQIRNGLLNLEGNWKKWYSNGTLAHDFSYDDATLPDGTWKWWDENGKLIKEYKYDHGISKSKSDFIKNNIYAP